MSILHKDSDECTTSDLDLVSLPPTQTGLEEALMCDVSPNGGSPNSKGLEFEFKGNSDHYMDPSEMYLYLKLKVKKNKTDDLDASCNVAVVNYLLMAIFNQIDIYLGTSKITPSNNNNAFRCYLEALLNFGAEAKQTQLTAANYYADKANNFDKIDGSNPGYTKRKVLTSKPFELYGKLHADICFQNRFILNKIDLIVKMYRNDDSFCLLSDGLNKYEIFIETATLYMRKCKVSPSIMLSHAMQLEKDTLKMPITRTETNVNSIPIGSTNQIYLLA